MGSSGTVPVIDIAPFRAGARHGSPRPGDGRRAVIDQVRQALETIGFFVITGHGIAPDLQARTLQVAREFFDLPEDEKLDYCEVPRSFMGYNPVGAERVAYAHHDESAPDLKANFTMGRMDVDERDPYYSGETGRQMFQPNIWPVRPARFRPILTEYSAAGETLALTLMEIFALALDLPQHYFADKLDKSMNFLRVLDYPALVEPPRPNQFRIGPHSDYGTLTLVTADGPGLQVKTRAGEWEDVPYVPHGIQVNIGDMMEQWTNDRWVSTQHRVLVPADPAARQQRRQAIAFFLTANYDTVIAPFETLVDRAHPARYAPVSAGQDLLDKLVRQYTRESQEEQEAEQNV
jgi:isopenicillin N synthase-like dioxygenase